jgi:ribose transport system permease protein
LNNEITVRNKRKNSQRIVNTISSYGVYIVFLAVCVYFAFSSSAFLSLQNFASILYSSSSLGLVAIGMFLVLIIAGIDISVAGNMYFAAVVAMLMFNLGMINIWETFIVGTIAGLAIGCLNGLLIAKFKIVPFIATLSTWGISKGLGILISQQQTIILPLKQVAFISSGIFGIPFISMVFVAFVLIFHFIVKRTQFGRQIFAIGNNDIGARVIGIKVDKQIFTVYAICGALTGLAGVIEACRISSVPQSFATGNEFLVISASIIGGASLFGGKGRMFPGAIIGIMMMQLIVNGLTLVNANPYIYILARGVIIFVAVAFDSIRNKGDLK